MCNKFFIKHLAILFILFFLLISIIEARETSNLKNTNTTANQSSDLTIKNSDETQKYKNQFQYIELSNSIENTIKEEKKNLYVLKENLSKINKDHLNDEQTLNSYKIQISSYTNLLALETTQVKELDKIYSNTILVINQIDSKNAKLKENLESLKHLHLETSERYSTNKKQLSEISIEKISDELTVTEIIVENLETLTMILNDKLKLMDKIQSIYNAQTQINSEIKQSFVNFRDKCRIHIQEKKTKALFQRKSNLKQFMGTQQIITELNILFTKWQMLFSKYYWISFFYDLWNSFGIFMFTSMIVMFFIIAFSFQFKVILNKGVNKLFENKNFKICHFILKLFTNSTILIGFTLFFIIFSNIMFSPIVVVLFTKNLLILWLFSRWILDAIKIWNENREKELKIPDNILTNILFFIIVLRTSCIFYMIIYFGLEGLGQLLLIIRLLFEIGLLIINVLFWKKILNSIEKYKLNNLFRVIYFRIAAIFINSILCISLIMDLSGFDQLSIHWQLSWAKTTIVSLWMVLFFMLIREFDNYKPAIQLSDDLQHNTQKTVKWAFIRVSYLLWALTTIIMILFAWGVSFKRIVSLFNILNHPIPIGSMNICLPGFVYFFLILIFTHMIVKIWRNTILKNMLAHSGMATGIQETISTVTSYSFWVFGIIIALNAVGITTTSLTFAFGAFGIGLGFGLQNIFNNFISGLILLFERPIQVGDWVEINNIWGTVKKINVRSTVVQTADNASLIIPNSEFISSRLTNWSFKDLKIRRKINIGVAYGSDINKVKEILLEIAKSNSNVYRRPEPDVVFIDFGDSALLFQLRIWVHVDFSISTQSNIRFEIDRLFKENNINIPFPQQDVHIYSHKM
ncbi:membrane protein containing Mechanosensitive ion channel MscS domain protein [Candidatus Magnetomorum sp. HK-1]|nr:membrane protein containing Mechanosensitive ion channel MscS domain protein [Candidatus Magnetomorum sp. HK-1]